MARVLRQRGCGGHREGAGRAWMMRRGEKLALTRLSSWGHTSPRSTRSGFVRAVMNCEKRRTFLEFRQRSRVAFVLSRSGCRSPPHACLVRAVGQSSPCECMSGLGCRVKIRTNLLTTAQLTQKETAEGWTARVLDGHGCGEPSEARRPESASRSPLTSR